MLLIYTGNGKGKTSALVGQVIRAHGQSLRVAVGQFMKQEGVAGEQRVLKELLGDNYFICGQGFFRNEDKREQHREACLQVLNWAHTKIATVDLLALDEILYALGAGLLEDKEVQALVDEAKTHSVHLVFSGRGLPDWLLPQADIVTEMKEVRHIYASGGKAVKGIEF